MFDMGGHVIFSHYQYFDELIDTALPDGDGSWNTLERVSYVWLKDRWVAYPFQNNVSALDADDQIKCLTGLVEAKVANAVAQSKPRNFDEWILRVMGPGIADLFMRPYNFKVWAVPTTKMQCEWLGERVATVDVDRAISNVLHKKEDAGWGPNAVFRFPKEGGTGGIWKAVAKLLPESKQRYGAGNEVVHIDKDKKEVTFASGNVIAYDKLISTLPLDVTLRWAGRPDLADGLFYSSTHVVGIGMRGTCPHGLKCWLYFPEDNCPFYRTTVFSHYAAKNCPDAATALPTLVLADGSAPASTDAEEGPYWSLMFEISESSYKPVDMTSTDLGGIAGRFPQIVKDTIQGAINTKLISDKDAIVSVFHRRLEHGYPTPSVERDGVLAQALPFFKAHDVWSRGRFGSYKYEVGNQDHSLMLGVECVDNILFGVQELSLDFPNVVNPRRNVDLLYSNKTIVSVKQNQ